MIVILRYRRRGTSDAPPRTLHVEVAHPLAKDHTLTWNDPDDGVVFGRVDTIHHHASVANSPSPSVMAEVRLLDPNWRPELDVTELTKAPLSEGGTASPAGSKLPPCRVCGERPMASTSGRCSECRAAGRIAPPKPKEADDDAPTGPLRNADR